MTVRRLKKVQATSLRQAMELCLEFARVKHNRSVQRVADLMGVSSHWTLYKWLESGKLPTNLIIPFEAACGATFVTTYLTHTSGKLAIDFPIGKRSSVSALNQLQAAFTDALGLLVRFYDGQANSEDTLAALKTVMEGLGWQHANVIKHQAPELELEEGQRS